METPTAPRRLTPQQVKELQAAASSNGRYGARDALMIRMAYVHGLRAVEVTGLQWIDVDLVNRNLTVRRAKGSKDSTHPLTPDVIRAEETTRRPRWVRLQVGTRHPSLTQRLWQDRATCG